MTLSGYGGCTLVLGQLSPAGDLLQKGGSLPGHLDAAQLSPATLQVLAGGWRGAPGRLLLEGRLACPRHAANFRLESCLERALAGRPLSQTGLVREALREPANKMLGPVAITPEGIAGCLLC
jgi:hypothetical protein